MPAPVQGQALVDETGHVWLPYDLPHLRRTAAAWSPLTAHREVRHAGRRAFRWSRPPSDTLNVLNGMGVTLGDSIIGMNALAWLKRRHPSLRMHLYRTPHAPSYVERLYRLARPLVDAVHYLPRALQSMPDDVIDLSDFLHWPRFAHEPMVDFFLKGLGIASETVPAGAKANRWLSRLMLPELPPPWNGLDYVMLCDQASTPLRTIPPPQALALVDRAWRHYRLPVLGFHPIPHPHYHDICGHSLHVEHFMAWVRSASVVVGTDSAGIHVAAGFDVPTLAVFVSIDPHLRVRDYPHCRSLDVRTATTSGLHESRDPAVLEEVRRIWQAVVEADLPWPDPTQRPLHSDKEL